MDSPTRRQLVVGFLEPAGEKNDLFAQKPSDWKISAAIHGTDQWHVRQFFSVFLQKMFTPRELRKELRVLSEWCVHCSVISASLKELGLKITSEVFIINKKKNHKVTSSSYIHIHRVQDIGKTAQIK